MGRESCVKKGGNTWYAYKWKIPRPLNGAHSGDEFFAFHAEKYAAKAAHGDVQ